MLRENSAWKRMWFTLQYPALYYYEKQTVSFLTFHPSTQYLLNNNFIILFLG